MLGPLISEKILVEAIAKKTHELVECQRGLSIGLLLGMIRRQLKMSQRTLSKKSGVPQTTISRIEMGKQQPTIRTLNSLLGCMQCGLVISVLPKKNLNEVLLHQARKKAKERIQYSLGTMSLENQLPEKDFIRRLVEEETNKVLQEPGFDIWKD